MSLGRAVELLSNGRWAEGARLLAAELERDLPDDQLGPAYGMYGQALLELGRLSDAKAAVRQSMRVAKRRGDIEGLTALRALNGRVYEALAREQDQERVRREEALARSLPLTEMLADATTDAERAAACLQKANALLDGEGDPSQHRAADLARQALSLATAAGATRETVLAHLCLARADASAVEAHLRAAHAVADQAEEAQLVAAIARAARAAGVDFGTHRF